MGVCGAGVSEVAFGWLRLGMKVPLFISYVVEVNYLQPHLLYEVSSNANAAFLSSQCIW